MTYAGTVRDYYFYYSHGAFFLGSAPHSTQPMRGQLTEASTCRRRCLWTGDVQRPVLDRHRAGMAEWLLPEVSRYLQRSTDERATIPLRGNAHNSLLHFQPIWRAGPNECSIFILPSPFVFVCNTPCLCGTQLALMVNSYSL